MDIQALLMPSEFDIGCPLVIFTTSRMPIKGAPRCPGLPEGCSSAISGRKRSACLLGSGWTTTLCAVGSRYFRRTRCCRSGGRCRQRHVRKKRGQNLGTTMPRAERAKRAENHNLFSASYHTIAQAEDRGETFRPNSSTAWASLLLLCWDTVTDI